MARNPLAENIIRLSYAQIVLHHAEQDSIEDFTQNLQDDLNTQPELTANQSEQSSVLPQNIEEETTPESKKSKIKSRLKRPIHLSLKSKLIAALSLVLILPSLGLLIWSNLSYKDKILPRTFVSEVQLNKSPEKALEQLELATKDYKIKLNYQNQTKQFSPLEAGLNLDLAQTLEKAKQESNKVRFLQKPFAIFKSRNISMQSSVDDESLKVFLQAQNYGDKLPEDAKLSFSSDTSQFEIIPEVAGRGIDAKAFATKLLEYSSSLSQQELKLGIEDVQPDLTTQSITKAKEEANSFLKLGFTIKTPERNYSPSAETIKDWLILEPNLESSTYDIKLNTDAQKAYINTVIGKVNRGMEKRLIATIDGSDMVIQNGSTGLSVTNSESVKSQLISLVSSKKSGTITLETKEEQISTENVAASGGRWIFADISQFRVYAYEGANLINSFAMSSGAPETPTPPGNYSVMSKVRVKTMRGGTPGTRDYYSVPNIEWVAYFKSGGYAMHGVYWHNNFGVKNTSHGCMGMRNADANWVYNFIDIGTPVIIVP